MFHTKDIDICSMYIYNQFNFFFFCKVQSLFYCHYRRRHIQRLRKRIVSGYVGFPEICVLRIRSELDNSLF